MKTAGVRALVEEALATIFWRTDNVIVDVFLAIEQSSGWRRRYLVLCQELGTGVVNQWGGRYVRLALGRPSTLGRTLTSRCGLIGSYTVLDSREFSPRTP